MPYLQYYIPQKHKLLWTAFTGVLLGLLHLTRHISLVLIPVLLLVWWLKPNNDLKFNFGIILLMYFVIYFSWVKMGLNHDYTIFSIIGMGIGEKGSNKVLTLSRLISWCVFYSSYYVLMIAPVFNLLTVFLLYY